MFLHKPFNTQIAHKLVGTTTNLYGKTADVSNTELNKAAQRASKASVQHNNEVN